MDKQKLKTSVVVVAYNPDWAKHYQQEKELLISVTNKHIVEIEHIGSTAIPHQKAKPIIDIMVAVNILSELSAFLHNLEELGYELIETDMKERYFLRRLDNDTQKRYHLHIVSVESWTTRKERLMRDYLLEHPEDVVAYGQLKLDLAEQFPDDSLAYTEAKTDFIQNLMNKACDKLSMKRINVWND